MIKTVKDRSQSSNLFPSGQNGVIKILVLKNGFVLMIVVMSILVRVSIVYHLYHAIFQDISHKGKDKEKGKSPNLVSEE